MIKDTYIIDIIPWLDLSDNNNYQQPTINSYFITRFKIDYLKS